MPYDPDKHNRRSIRLKGYDYSRPGFYYVTICTQDRVERFGTVSDAKMVLNDAGKLVDAEWNRIPERYDHVVMDEYKIMPNHLHGILEIVRRGGVTPPSLNTGNPCEGNPDTPNIGTSINTIKPKETVTNTGAVTAPLQSVPPLGKVIGHFKYEITKTLNEIDGTPGRKVLQRGFHDHIIRNEEELNRIRRYIIDNPKNWAEDENNPEKPKEINETDS